MLEVGCDLSLNIHQPLGDEKIKEFGCVIGCPKSDIWFPLGYIFPKMHEKLEFKKGELRTYYNQPFKYTIEFKEDFSIFYKEEVESNIEIKVGDKGWKTFSPVVGTVKSVEDLSPKEINEEEGINKKILERLEVLERQNTLMMEVLHLMEDYIMGCSNEDCCCEEPEHEPH